MKPWSSFNLFHLFPSLNSLLQVSPPCLTIFQLHIHTIERTTQPPSISMDAASLEAQRFLKEKTIRDCFIEDDMDNDMEEEEEGVGDCYAEDERKKKVPLRRGPGGISAPFCLVEKCGTDLTDARRYHRRHKVCELHSKAPVVIVAGLRQRFCQQCSRFHELSEFDEIKRSCRRRLAGHNERRRKSTAETTGEGPSSREVVGSHQLKDSQCRQVK